MKVLHVTPGLESGGAEMVLCSLVSRLEAAQFSCRVVSLTDEGPLVGARIRAAGVPLECLNGTRGIPNPRLISRLAAIIRRERPDAIQTWMYHGDLIGGLAARLAGGAIPVFWGVHSTRLDPRQTKLTTRVVIALNRRAANTLPSRIVCCSEATRQEHAALGYPMQKMTVIPNGIDVDLYARDDAARASVRAEIGVAPETPLVGLLARFHPQKDHANFFAAAGILAHVRPDAHFLLCGSGVAAENAELMRLVEAAGVARQTHLLGLRTDTPRVTAALDVATCSSVFGEAWPLIIGEAMASEVPVVTTDLAGPASVVGESGRVVPIRDPEALARTWHEVLGLAPEARRDIGRLARLRIVKNFSMTRMVAAYQDLYLGTADAPAQA